MSTRTPTEDTRLALKPLPVLGVVCLYAPPASPLPPPASPLPLLPPQPPPLPGPLAPGRSFHRGEVERKLGQPNQLLASFRITA